MQTLLTKIIVGIRCSDPHLPGRMYLSEEGALVKNVKQARQVDPESVSSAIKEVKAFSPKIFTVEVASDNDI